MELLSIDSPAFREYGQVVEGCNLSAFLDKLRATPQPSDGVVYVPSDAALESDPAYSWLRDGYYGGMPIQIGYCNGVNSKLNCLEYHRDSEVNIAAEDIVLLVARQPEIEDGLLDTAKVKAFLLPAGQAAELYATTLHYAPCSAVKGAGFRVAVVLPKGTNTAKPDFAPKSAEDRLMTARNKWLLAHPDSSEAKGGAVVGLTGPNIDLEEALW